MAAETKTDTPLSSVEENKILRDIFQNLDEMTRDIIAHLRIALVNQNNTAIERVQRYLKEILSPEIVTTAAAKIPGGIPPSSFGHIQNAVGLSLSSMVAQNGFNDKQIGKFYKNIVKFIVETVPVQIIPSAIMHTKRRHIYKLVRNLMPDFWLVEGRLKKFDDFWYKEVVAFADKIKPKHETIQKEMPLSAFSILIGLVGIGSVAHERSLRPILYTLVSYALLFILLHARGKSLSGPAFKHMAKLERALCRFRDIRQIKTHQVELDFLPLPDLKEMRKLFIAPPVPSHAMEGSAVEESKSSTARLKRRLAREQPVPTPPTAAAAAPSPTIVDLSEALGHGRYPAHHAGRPDDTLFRFATPAGDIRYMFIHPQLKEEMEEALWLKYMNPARARLVTSEVNQQGIKQLEGEITDRETETTYSAVELKILGARGRGAIRLLGARVTVEKDHEKYNIYVFNTLWHKKEALPRHFNHPLCSTPACAAAAVTQASAFFPPAPSDGLPSYEAGIASASLPVPASDPPPAYIAADAFSAEAERACL